ncbi:MULTISPECIES: helix-turn-helix domain-containing protein [Aquimarina]|nr:MULTISPECIES: AraC family transcriptional regulator [Aquimarina]
MAITIVNLLHQSIMSLTGLQDNGQLYLIILVINTIYIYWVGLETLTKSKFLFNSFSLKQKNTEQQQPINPFAQKLEHYIKTEEVFTNKNLKVADLAYLLETTEKELSSYIHESFNMSFSDYINQHRVEKVKELLISENQNIYTLLAIAESAGFSSKSSFNTVFKKVTGITPTQYKVMHKK